MTQHFRLARELKLCTRTRRPIHWAITRGHYFDIQPLWQDSAVNATMECNFI